MIKVSSQISGEKINFLISNIWVTGWSYKKRYDVFISYTIHQDKFQMDERFQCEQLKR